MRYATELQCLSPVQDIAQYLLPQLEKIEQGTAILLNIVTHMGTQQKRDLDAALRAAGTTAYLIPYPDALCQKNINLNYHLGAEGVMSPGRIQDTKGAKHLVISYHTTAGSVAPTI